MVHPVSLKWCWNIKKLGFGAPPYILSEGGCFQQNIIVRSDTPPLSTCCPNSLQTFRFMRSWCGHISRWLCPGVSWGCGEKLVWEYWYVPLLLMVLTCNSSVFYQLFLRSEMGKLTWMPARWVLAVEWGIGMCLLHTWHWTPHWPVFKLAVWWSIDQGRWKQLEQQAGGVWMDLQRLPCQWASNKLKARQGAYELTSHASHWIWSNY